MPCLFSSLKNVLSLLGMAGYGRAVLSAPPRVSLRGKKNSRHAPTILPAWRYTPAPTEAVQPPDDRTYSAEVTAIRRNLPHHRICIAQFSPAHARISYHLCTRLSRRNSEKITKFPCHFREKRRISFFVPKEKQPQKRKPGKIPASITRWFFRWDSWLPCA